VSARERLEDAMIGDYGMYESHVMEMLDAYAHELAEKIRNTPSPRDPDDYGGLVDMGADWAANLIDPEVSSGS
jgi:hypothetical protein